jgi:hypothetical protein
MKTCKFCQSFVPETEEICRDCSSKLGLVPGSGVRQGLPCQRCNHTELVRALARDFTTSPGQYGHRQVNPMGVAIAPTGTTTFFSGRPDGLEDPAPSQVVGILDMYVCLRCGFTEWYCRDPKSIPIGQEFGTEQITVAPTTPYR